ncbi:hypothetical protein CF326_g9795, partial [Tilletia indica]
QQQKDFGASLVTARSGLPTAFSSSPPRDPSEHAGSHYKFYEWSLVLYSYLVPFLFSVAAPIAVIDMLSNLEAAVRLTMSDVGCTSTQLGRLQTNFVNFVQAWEKLYVRGNSDLLHRSTVSMHHLLHIWYFIYCHGSVQITSQAQCEREIGLVKRSLRSFKSPFVGIMNNVLQREHLRIIDILLPSNDEEDDDERRRTFEVKIRNDRHRRLTQQERDDETECIQTWSREGTLPRPTPPHFYRGKYVLCPGVSIRGSRTLSASSRKSCYFAARTREGIVYGEAVHFICFVDEQVPAALGRGEEPVAPAISLVLFREIENIIEGSGIIRGVWSRRLHIMFAGAIEELVGVYEIADTVYVLRKQAWLSMAEIYGL